MLLVWLFYLNAWVADDAFITFRSVEQLFAGNGPRWNPHERVQAFTHPLWFACLAVTRTVTRSLYWSSLAISLFATATAVFSTRKLIEHDAKRWILLVALLASSKSFIDYAWSGLETPLTYLLLIGFLTPTDHPPLDDFGLAPDVVRRSLLTSLLVLTHPDLVLIVAPALVVLAFRTAAPRLVVLRSLAVGLAPMILWGAFATLYYGTPIPNTAYAKLNTGVPAIELWAQGLRYLRQTLTWDPVTVLTCLAGVLMMFSWPRWRPFGAGLVLYFAYTLQIGGDFMAGRLFAPAFLASAVCVVHEIRRPAQQIAVFVTLAVLNIVLPGMPIRLPENYSVAQSFNHAASHGIADEKAVYFQDRSLRGRLQHPIPTPQFPQGNVVVVGAIGLVGYTAGTDRIIIDGHALADPLLARLPAKRPWRPGHFWRNIPAGYLESVRAGTNVVQNPQIRRIYADVLSTTQGPLLTRARLRAILRLHLRNERPDCIDPPCHNLRIHDEFPRAEYRPRMQDGGGEVLAIAREDRIATIAAQVALPRGARGQRVFVVTTAHVAESELSHPTEQPTEDWNGFTLKLTFASAIAAKRGLQTLCVAIESDTEPIRLLKSPNEFCSRLLLPARETSLAVPHDHAQAS